MAVELVSRGAQDVYLTGNPEVSFFRQNYKRYTNFAQRNVKLDFIGAMTASSEVYVKIPNKGDLLSYIWLDLGTGDGAGDATDSGLNCDDETNSATIELWIGGQLIDRQDAFFMAQHWNKYLADCGSKPAAASDLGDVTTSDWFPLHFFFCDSVPLPLVSLQYHEVEVRIKFANSNPSKVKFYANYIMLDTDERAAFVNMDHEILIEQMQKIGYSGNKFDLSLFNHPVKSLHFSSVTAGLSIVEGIQLYLNGTETFNTEMPKKFFNQVQGYYHSEFWNAELTKQTSELYMYSFALKASKHQPCGTCNFSRIDTGALNISCTGGTLSYLYAVNFNILRIKKGLAGLAFSN
jgi:hypothetical protein